MVSCSQALRAVSEEGGGVADYPERVLVEQVVLRTSVGDVEIELWPKEAPKVVALFKGKV
jgi:hypothetical protein